MENVEPVTNYMTATSNLITFSMDTDIREAIKTILKHKISGAPVLNDKHELAGILSEKDCLRLIIQGSYYEAKQGEGKVKEYMSSNVKTISSEKNMVEAAYEFLHSNYRRFPVVDTTGKLVGQISRRDVLKAVDKIKPSVDMMPSSWKHNPPA